MRRTRALCAALAATAIGATPAPAPTLAEALHGARHALRVEAGVIGGDGAPILAQAIGEARIVAVGEDHFTREIPAFVAALCDALAPQGLAALGLEIGPAAANQFGPALAAPDRVARTAGLLARYPNAVAFLDSRADSDAAAHCRRVGRGRLLPILGLDQEFIGSAGMVLDRILAAPLSPSARTAIRALRADERRDAAAAAASGEPGQLLLLSADPARLDRIAALLARGSSVRARDLFGELRESAAIYALDAHGDPAANTRRATLLKQHFRRFAPTAGKILLKFGDWHLYKGVNPLGNRDLGNYVAEVADGAGEQSLHILVLGARGVRATFAGYARPPRHVPFVMTDDPDYRWLQPAVDQQLEAGWTLFDLRRLRHRRIEGLSSDWSRVIAGYDLMVLVPVLTPSEAIGS